MRSVIATTCLMTAVALACGGGGTLEGKPSDVPTSGSNTAPPAGGGKVTTFAKSPDSLKVDKIGGSDGSLKPDGTMDAAFTADVEGPILSIFVVTTDATGTPDGNYQWDTVVATQDMPPEMKGVVKTGGMTGGVGVFENGQPINKPDGSLPTITGTHKYDLYVSNTGAFQPGAHFRIMAEQPDHTMLKGPIVTY